MIYERAQRALESEARRALASALSTLPGSKALLIDDALYQPRLSIASPLDLFADATFLHEHGIRSVLPLARHGGRALEHILEQPSIVILIRGVNAAAARAAVTVIRTVRERTAELAIVERQAYKLSLANGAKLEHRLDDNHGDDSMPEKPQLKFLILTTPRRSKIVEKVMQGAGLADIPLAPLPLGFLPFDADLVTLDWPDAYKQVVLEGDNSAILASAAALSSLENMLNLQYSTIRTAGAAAAAVAEDLLETHGQIYPRHFPDNATTSAPSSAPSSPSPSQLARRPSLMPAFVAQDAFSLMGGESQFDQENSEEDDNSITDKPSLAQVVQNWKKKRSVSLIIIDRGVDVVSPMLTQWTYEGLLDEAVGLHNNIMDLPISSIVSEDAMGILSSGPNVSGNVGTVRKRLRGDVDSIFAQLRDLNYWAAARLIGSVASSVRAYYDARPTRETAEIAQVKDYVKGLKEVKSEHSSAAAHTAIAAEISARTFDSYEFKQRFELEREMMEGSTATGRCVYITDAIARGESLAHILRLCCVWSMTSCGIDSEELDFVRRELLAIFGLGVLPLLSNLERAGMLVRSTRETSSSGMSWIPFPNFGGSEIASTIGSEDGRRMRASKSAAEYNWQFARAALRLVTEFDPDQSVEAGTVAAIAAPYSGYTPLSVRLVEAALSDEGWASLPPVVTHTSLLPPGHATVEHRRGKIGRSLHDDRDELDAVVLFVGGVARAEASAVRMAARASGMRALIATTAVVGPDEFVLSLHDGMGCE